MSSTSGRALSLLSQMMSLAALRVVLAATTSFSRGVMNSVTFVRGHAGQAVVAAGHDAQQLAVGVPSSVTAMVEWPVFSFSSRTSRGHIGGRLESEVTQASLVALTRATIAASFSMVWEP